MGSCEPVDKAKSLQELSVLQKIDAYLDLEQENGFSGLVSVKLEDELYTRGFGYANFNKEYKNSENTVFDIGSLTKQFTAAGILKLEMEGKLTVEDSLGKFFDDIPGDKSAITLHQLLTHTSGIKRSMGYDYKRTSRNEFLRNVFSSELRFTPGSEYSYSHAAYSLLGAVIEEVSGSSYEEYLNEKIFKPAGMENTGYVIPLWENQQIAHGYRRCKDWGKPMDMPWAIDGPYWNLKANAGLISSGNDLISWIEAISDDEILSREAKNKFISPHVREVKEGKQADSYYGYGWVLGKSRRGTDVFFHNGGNRRFYTDLIRYESEDVTILVMSNVDKPGNDGISWELAKIIFWADYEANVQGASQNCMDSLPDNRIGKVAGDLLSLIQDENPLTKPEEFENLFADYLKDRRDPQHIIDYLNFLKKSFKQITINNVVITNHQIMDLYLFYNQEGTKKNLRLSLVFDEEDDYLIRWLSYDTRYR